MTSLRVVIALLAAAALPVQAETIFGLTTTGVLLRFDSAAPGALLGSIPITGLEGGESLVGIDSRPADGLLYGVSDANVLYVINDVTGEAQQVGILPSALIGDSFGLDFNPTVDRIRMVSDAEQNLRVIPTDASVIVDAALNYFAADVNFGLNPNIVASAYINNFLGATSTTLYCIDMAAGTLVIQNPPNNGTLNTVGPLGYTMVNGNVSMDISPGGIAYAMFPEIPPTSSRLATINLATGAATFIGAIGGDAPLVAIAVKLGAAPQNGEPLIGLSPDNELVKFFSHNPGATTTLQVTGLALNETLVGIDYQPASGRLYGLSDLSNIYTINTATGAASLVAALNTPLPAGELGVDFNPAADRIRVVAETDENYRVNPADGNVLVDLPLNYAPGDPNFAFSPGVTAVAYDSNFVNTGATVLYGIDTGTNALVRQNPPNTGILTTVGPLGLNPVGAAGIDVSGRTSTAYACMSAGAHGHSSLYTIDTATGAATLIGGIGGGIHLVGISSAGFSHSADVNIDNSINLSELLRVVQFYNLQGYGCAIGASEDGFAPGPGSESCIPHSGDYNSPAPDFAISLTELLRMVQLYNAGTYYYCPLVSAEDEFCVGV